MSTDHKSLALEAIHQKHGAKMIPFAGYLMPLHYTSVVEEHKKVRNGVGIFDVSHMGEFFMEGAGALDLIQEISSNDAAKLSIGEAQYSCMPNDQGGIVDDLIIYKLAEEKYLLVVNAANIEKDWNWITSRNKSDVSLTNRSDDFSLFAVQGPKAAAVLQKISPKKLNDIPYYSFCIGEIGGIEDVIISATGYTGAGGFELYVSNEQAPSLWEAIIAAGAEEGIQPIGLAARDTLRLEMGYCLYGNDIDDTTSPLEAGLGWITKFSKSFTNWEALKRQKEEGVNQRLVAFEMIEKGIPRKDYDICDAEGTVIGRVTSGGQSPMLGKGIGLGYVPKEYRNTGSELFIGIRTKLIQAKVVKLPFIK